MSSSKIVLVTGASRGIGKGLVEHLAEDPNNKVIGSVRNTVDFGLPNVETITLDQQSSASVKAAATKVPELDTLIINGAIGASDFLLTMTEERFQEYLNTNVTGVLRIVQAFLPALKARKTRKILIISSTAGSLTRQIGNNKFGFRGPYAMSKTATNMMAVQIHNELLGEGFTIIPICPGWVATDMGNAAGEGGMSVAESVSGILKVLDAATTEDSAKFYRYDGEIVPW